METGLPALPLPIPIPAAPVNGNHSNPHHRQDPSRLSPPRATYEHAANPLEEELPNVTNDLVPLAYLIDRLVTQSYSDLSTLLETLPSHSDQQRKQLLVDYVLHTRRQFLKLLVLTRWSSESARIKKSINIIGFLSNQNHPLEQSVQNLTQAVEGLRGARVRNYDLETSLDVLQSGEYKGLPSAIREAFEGQEKLGDEQVIETMRECEHVMRWRLKMGKELLPKQMLDNYRIADGRVTFRVDGLWEASFVYSGTETHDLDSDDPPSATTSTALEPTGTSVDVTPEDQSEWYFLGVKYLFNVRDERGGTWNPTPAGPLKQHLVDLCNAQLARRPFLPVPPPASAPFEDAKPPLGTSLEAVDEDAAVAKYSSELQEARSKRRRDQPLQRGYTFLQRLALSYQLESIYSQAVGLIRSSDWSGCGLKVEINGERDEVKLSYWNDTQESSKKPNPSQSATSSKTSSPGGTLIFASSSLLGTSPSAEATLTMPTVPTHANESSPIVHHLEERQTINRRKKALESLLNRTKVASAKHEATSSTSITQTTDPTNAIHSSEYPPDSLRISFLPPSSPSAIAIPPESLLDILNPNETDKLDVQKMLMRITQRHTEETIRAIARELCSSDDLDSIQARTIYPSSLARPEFTGSSVQNGGEDLEMANATDETHEKREEEESGLEQKAPYVFVPLVEPHALTIHVEPKSGKLELRSASSTGISEDAKEGAAITSGREARLRSASERLNSLRFAVHGNAAGGSPEGNDAWLKTLPEIIAKIRATTILDEISTLFTLLSLPTLRRLPLPPRELSKFGPLPSLALGRPTFLFVPLNAHHVSRGGGKGEGLEGFYLAIVSIGDGVRMGLVGTKECTDASSGSTWVEITQVGWIYQNDHDEERKGKQRRTEDAVEGEMDRGSNFGFAISAETLRRVWNYCVHRILLHRLEQQLHSREIPYRSSAFSTSLPFTSSAPTVTSRIRLNVDLVPPPFLVLDTRALSRLPTENFESEKRSIFLRTAALRCDVDELSGIIRTTLHIRLHPSFPSSSLPPPFPSTALAEDQELTKLPRNVYYNPSTRTIVFVTENEVLGSIERILMAFGGVMQELTQKMKKPTEAGTSQ